MARIGGLPGRDQEFSTRRIVHFDLFASSGNENSTGAQLYRFRGEFEAAVVQRRRGPEFSCSRIIDFRAVHFPLPIPIIGATRDEHPAIGKQAGRMFVARGLKVAGGEELFCGGIVELGTGGNRIAAATGNQDAAVVEQRGSLRNARKVHRADNFEFGEFGAKDFRGCDSARGITVRTASDEDVAIAEQRGTGLSAFAIHFRDYGEFPGGGIVEFGGIGAIAPGPPAHNQYVTGVEQDCGVSNAGESHRTRCLKFSGGGIEQFGGTVEILIATHASGNKNFSAWQESRGVAGTRLKHGRRGSNGTCGRCFGENGGAAGVGYRSESGDDEGEGYEDSEQSAHGTS